MACRRDEHVFGEATVEALAHDLAVADESEPLLHVHQLRVARRLCARDALAVVRENVVQFVEAAKEHIVQIHQPERVVAHVGEVEQPPGLLPLVVLEPRGREGQRRAGGQARAWRVPGRVLRRGGGGRPRRSLACERHLRLARGGRLAPAGAVITDVRIHLPEHRLLLRARLALDLEEDHLPVIGVEQVEHIVPARCELLHRGRAASFRPPPLSE
mmetsp:Transcript_38639/g.90711  ORF Transcript_38639/g.90711 Transcript_38639/m.90711 type:complete len:215 (-) Transcript_38639:34-678(-)